MKSLLFGAAALLIHAVTATGYSQILEYKFNESGSSAASTGSESTSLTLYNQSNAASDLHGEPGSGLSGAPDERAFNNSDSTRMGAGTDGKGTGAAGGVANAGNVDILAGLTSFTLQGWIKTSVADSSGAARIMEQFESGAAATKYLSLSFTRNANSEGKLSISINGVNNTVVSLNTSVLGITDEWIFFAVTYDSSKASDQVSFYAGTTIDEVQSIGTATLNVGVLNGMNGNLVFGNSGDRIRPFDGWLDNIRLYGSSEDGSGALSLTDLENVRHADAIPEPQVAMLLLFGTAWLAFSKFSR